MPSPPRPSSSKPGEFQFSVAQHDLQRFARADPDPGSAGFLNALNAGTARSTIVSAILTSGEYTAREVTSVYSTYLGRTPSAAEIGYWQSTLTQSGQGAGQPSPDDRFLITVLSSAEYLQKSGGTNQGWIQNVYGELLGRSPDSSGLDYAMAQVLSGYSQQRESVVNTLINSQEYRSDQVVSYYQTFLGRTPSSSEVAGWVNAIQAGANEDAIITAILSSNESLQRQGGAEAQWLDAVFEDLLGRAAQARIRVS